MTVPSLLDALRTTIERGLERSEDKIIRIQDLLGVSLSEVVEALDSAGRMRFGVTKSVAKGKFRRSGVSDDAKQITRWRNESIERRRAAPLVILGRADGREEAGLRRVPIVIREVDVLRAYARLLDEYLAKLAESSKPRAFVRDLVQMSQDGLIDPVALALFCSECFATEARAVQEPQKNLYQLRLIPDPRAMDTESPGGRLSTNYRVAEFLRNQPDTTIEEKQLARLEDAAGEGNSAAAAALKYRATQDKKYLRQATLDGVLAAISSKSSDPGNSSAEEKGKKNLDLFSAVDLGILTTEMLDAIGNEWKLSPSSASISRNISDDSALRMSLKALPERIPLGNTIEEQVIASERKQAVPLEDAMKYFGKTLLSAAENADALQGSRAYAPLVETLLKARLAILPLVGWADNLLECLITKQEFLALADDYLIAWEQLVDQLLRDAGSSTSEGLRRIMAGLDGHWEKSSESNGAEVFEAVELLPIHPFVLKPVADLATLARQSLSEKNLGAKLRWAFDRTLPAYPAVWIGSEILLHQAGSTCPVFSRRPRAIQPPVTSRSGLSEVVRSFIGLNPFAASHLTLLLIDPPPGGGVGGAVNEIVRSGLVSDATVYVLNTQGKQADLGESRAKIEDLGTERDVRKWMRESSITAHIVVWFLRARVAHGGSHAGTLQPSRGLHNALGVSLITTPGEGSFGVSDVCTPEVSVQPRDSNSFVRKYMELSRRTSSPENLYRVTPMLPEEEVEAIEDAIDIAEWVVIGAPGPIGLVPPRRFKKGGIRYLGAEEMGAYGLFVFGGDLFAVRRKVQDQLVRAPLAPDIGAVEEQIETLALSTPNGVLRLGRSPTGVLAQIGVVAASHFAGAIASGE